MAEEYRTPPVGAAVTTPEGPGVMAGVTGSRYAVDMPDGSTRGFDPLSVRVDTTEIPVEFDYGPGEQCGEESLKGDSGPCVKAEGHPDTIHEDARGHRFYA